MKIAWKVAGTLCVLPATTAWSFSSAHPLSAQEQPADETIVEAGAALSAETGAGAAASALRPPAGLEGVALLRLQEPPLTLRVGARIQLRFLGTSVDDESATGAFLIPRTRLSFSGAAYEDFAYQLQLELSNPSVALIDANVRYRLAPLATVWLGRGKAPMGRQRLTSSGDLHFVERNIVDQRFSAPRHQGVALLGQDPDERFEYQVGVYNRGASLSSPGTPFTTVGRVVWTPFGGYAPRESAHDYPESPRMALGISGMSAPEAGPGDGDITRVNVEFAYKSGGLNMTSELYREWLDPAVAAASVVTSDGFYYQMGYLFSNRAHELAGRLAQVDTRGEAFRVNEFGVAHSYYMREHRLKVQSDLRYITDRRAAVADRFEVRTQLQIGL